MKETLSYPVVPVSPELLSSNDRSFGGVSSCGLDISLEGFTIHAAESTSMVLLSAALEVVRNVE